MSTFQSVISAAFWLVISRFVLPKYVPHDFMTEDLTLLFWILICFSALVSSRKIFDSFYDYVDEVSFIVKSNMQLLAGLYVMHVFW